MSDALTYIVNHLFKVELWLIIAAWFSAFLGAIIYYVWQYPQLNKSFKGFFIYTFPKELWFHPSCRRDYWFAAINRVIEPLAVGIVLVNTAAVSTAAYYVMTLAFGQHTATEFSWTLWAFMIFIALIIQDFSTWYSHYLEHKIPALWEIHKVHHSAEILNPISNRLHHPLQLVWEGGLSNVGTGFVLGIVSYIMRVPVLDNACLGADAYFFGNVLSFYILRHSHIPLHYGKWEKWFLSPSQHILHHSVEKVDWDVNFGLFTSVWDRLFKTIRYSKKGYEFRLGEQKSVPGYQFRLGLEPQYQRQYTSVIKIYTTPIINLVNMGWKQLGKMQNTVLNNMKQIAK